jgi:putative transposase
LSIISDNGTELTSRAVLAWAQKNGVAWHYIDPGKPGPISNFVRGVI